MGAAMAYSPRRIPFLLFMLSMFLLVRAVFVFLSPIGPPVGMVDTVLRGDPEWLVFTVRERTLERFDGLQLDLAEREKPFGFGVEEIRLCPARGKPDGRSVFEAKPGTRVAVPLPPV